MQSTDPVLLPCPLLPRALAFLIQLGSSHPSSSSVFLCTLKQKSSRPFSESGDVFKLQTSWELVSSLLVEDWEESWELGLRFSKEANDFSVYIIG